MNIQVLEKMKGGLDESGKYFREVQGLLNGVEVKGQNVTLMAMVFENLKKFAEVFGGVYEILSSEIELEKQSNGSAKIKIKEESRGESTLKKIKKQKEE